MRLLASMFCLVLALGLRGAEPAAPTVAPRAPNSSHAWPPLATETSRPAPVAKFTQVPVAPSTDAAVKALEQAEASRPVRATVPSLMHFDLTSHVRVALVTQPHVTTNIFGQSTSNVGLFSLQW